MCRIDLFVQTTSQTPTKWIYACCSWVHKLKTTWFQQSSQGPQHASQLTVADNWCLQKSFHDVPHPLEQTDLQSPSLRNWAPNTVIFCHSHAYHWGTKMCNMERWLERSTWQTATGWHPFGCWTPSADVLKIPMSVLRNVTFMHHVTFQLLDKTQAALPPAGCVKMEIHFTNYWSIKSRSVDAVLKY